LPAANHSGTLVARLPLQTENPVEVYAMTRTLGAALGVAIVLLFFASLTFEQNRVLTIARSAAASHR
jgi:hypothetical protein